jgi:hypothetical protein
MKVEIIKDGVLQPMELFIALFYMSIIVFFAVLIYTVGDYWLIQFPEVEAKLRAPAPTWLLIAVWVVILVRTNKGNN